MYVGDSYKQKIKNANKTDFIRIIIHIYYLFNP